MQYEESQSALHSRLRRVHMADDLFRNSLRLRNGRVKKAYILLSHVLGRNTPSIRPPHRAKLEQAIAAVLREGLYAPFHIKTLKKITATTAMGTCALSFFESLINHAEELLDDRSVVLVVDQLSALEQASLGEAESSLNTLTQKGFKVLTKYNSDELVFWQQQPSNQEK